MSLLKTAFNILARNAYIVQTGRIVLANNLINNSRLYEQCSTSLAKRYNVTRPLGSLRLNIETTLACNARCIMCTRRSYPLKGGTMPYSLCKKIFREAQAIGVRKAILSVYGEPLMDPEFVRKAKLSDDANIEFSFYTNGSLLTESLSKELLDLNKFSRIYFSVNGFEKETYESIMVNLSRDAVYSNILRFLELRNKLRPDLSVWVNCVLFSKNVHEKRIIGRFFSKEKGVECVYFSAPRNRGGTQLDMEMEGLTIQFNPFSKRNHKLLPCKFLWEDLFIYWNGDVGVCCEDTAARRIIIGNLKEQSLDEVWTGKRMQALREQHLAGKRYLHAVCGKSCDYNTFWLKPYA